MKVQLLKNITSDQSKYRYMYGKLTSLHILSNEIIVSNGIIGSVNQCLSLNILVDKDRGSVYMYGSFRNHGFGFGFGYSPAEALSTYTQSTLKM